MATWTELNEPEIQIGIQRARATRKFIVETDRTTTEVDVLNDVSCPGLGSVHPRINGLFCTNRSVSREDKGSHITWRVTLEYEIPSGGGEQQQQENPLLDPIEISWSSQQYTAPVVRDKNGQPVKNTAGDPFDPAPEMQFSRYTITIRRNLAAVPSWILGYVDTVNNAAWSVDGIAIPKGAAKIDGISVSGWQFRGSVAYRTVDIRVSVKAPSEGGWQLVLASMGYHELDDEGKRKRIMLNGQPCSNPQFLGEDGKKADQPHFIKFDVYQEANFALLLS